MAAGHRSGVAFVASLLAAGLALAGQPLAQADALSDAKAKLATLQGEASAADEQYNQVQAGLDAAQLKQQQIAADIVAQQAQVEVLRTQVAIVTLQQFQDRGLGSAVALFTSTDQVEALNRIQVTSMVSDTTTAILQNYQLSQAALADLEQAQEATVASIEADKVRLQELKDQASAKVKEAQTLVNRLTAEQQAALAAANAAAWGGQGLNYAPPPPVQNGAAAQAIVDFAMARVGYPYVYGGSGPNAYDCSGLTMAAYATVGIRLPHSAGQQFNLGVPVARDDLAPGDLIFMYPGPAHVGIYVGAGMIVDARDEQLGIQYRPLTNAVPVTGARRLL